MTDTTGFSSRAAVKDASKKTMLSSDAVDVNQLLPFKYDWAWQGWLDGNANHWRPTEVPMSQDKAQWESTKVLSPAERQLLLRVFGFMSTAESLVAGNLIFGVYPFIQAAEVRQYLIRQMYEESLHTEMFLYIIESLGLDEVEIYGAYAEVPTIHAKDEFEMHLTRTMLEGGVDTNTREGRQLLMKNLIGYYVILEGIFFYGGFAMIESLRRQNKMVGVGQQFEYTRRDEGVHVSMGINIIRTIREENPDVWDSEMVEWVYDNIREAVRLEADFTRELLPDGFIGISADDCVEYVMYIANRRMEQIGLSPVFADTKNPFPWMSESQDLLTEQNFFEGRVVDYQNASSLSWD